jgi:glycosyltransferase involved in cell wall biosynthesis
MIAIVEGQQQAGHSVAMICLRRESVEDYTFLIPHILGDNFTQDDAKDLIRDMRPNLVLCRPEEHGHDTLAWFARRQGCKVVQYDQSSSTRPDGLRALLKDIALTASRVLRRGALWRMSPNTGRQGERPCLWTRPYPFPMHTNADEDAQDSNGVDLTILFAGKLSMARKRHTWLLDALENVEKPAKVIFVGEGFDPQTAASNRSADYYEELIDRINRSEFHDMEVHVDMDYYALRQLYRKADIFVLATAREQYGISVLEAMASGCAVLCADSSGVACAIQHGNNGMLFEEQSFQDFNAKFLDLVNDAALRQRLGTAAFESVRDNHPISR